MKKITRDKFVTCFSPKNEPVEFCEDGEIVLFETQDCYGGRVNPKDVEADTVSIQYTNPATGPLYVNGAMPGDVLAVDILDIQVEEMGVTRTHQGTGALWEEGGFRTRFIPVKNGTACFNDVKWLVKPMIGVIGTPSETDVPTAHSFSGGGNMDSNIITAGTTVYFPVRVPGALLAMGDLHASMGDGEVVGTGIEIAGAITVRVRIIKNTELNWPVTETEDAWYVNTNGLTTDTGIRRGYKEIQRLVSKAYGWDNTDTAMYLSLQAMISANQACLGFLIKEENDGPTMRVGVPKLPDKPRLIG